MVVFLVVDVVGDDGDVRRGHGRDAVAALPLEATRTAACVRSPAGGCALHLSDEIGDRDGGGQPEEHVHVIFDATDRDNVAPRPNRLLRDDPMDRLFERRRQQRLPIPSPPYDVHEHPHTIPPHPSLLQR